MSLSQLKLSSLSSTWLGISSGAKRHQGPGPRVQPPCMTSLSGWNGNDPLWTRRCIPLMTGLSSGWVEPPPQVLSGACCEERVSPSPHNQASNCLQQDASLYFGLMHQETASFSINSGKISRRSLPVFLPVTFGSFFFFFITARSSLLGPNLRSPDIQLGNGTFTHVCAVEATIRSPDKLVWWDSQRRRTSRGNRLQSAHSSKDSVGHVLARGTSYTS